MLENLFFFSSKILVRIDRVNSCDYEADAILMSFLTCRANNNFIIHVFLVSLR